MSSGQAPYGAPRHVPQEQNTRRIARGSIDATSPARKYTDDVLVY
jgi:hypothetical protein